MNHEKIFKREDGTRVRITADYTETWRGGDKAWSFQVAICAPRKRKFETVQLTRMDFHALPAGSRTQERQRRCLKYVTASEIQSTMLELWEKMKPDVHQVLDHKKIEELQAVYDGKATV